MLRYSYLLFALITMSCSNATSNNGEYNLNNEVSQSEVKASKAYSVLSANIAMAIEKNDYRLLVASTRGTKIPGLTAGEVEQALALCGKKYMPNTGDVIRSEQDRVDRNKALDYMVQYNQKMWDICQNNN